MNRADGHLYSTDGVQMRLDYDVRTDGQPLYLGYAARGIATSQKGWMIYKYTFVDIGGTDFVSARQVANDTWDNRALASFA
jgi:hypothetical protein